MSTQEKYSPDAWERRKLYQRDYQRKRRRTPEGRMASKIAWKKVDADASKEKKKAWQRRAQIRYFLRKLGLTEKIYDELAAKGCAICRGFNNWPRLKTRLCLDHDHKTGKFRGLLCCNCNSALGYLKDDPDLLLAAAKYLQERR